MEDASRGLAAITRRAFLAACACGTAQAALAAATRRRAAARSNLRDAKPAGSVEVVVTECGEAAALPCRIHLADAAGEPVRADGLPFWHDHFVCPGRVQLDLPAGRYRFEIERGPEYERAQGEVEVGDNDNGRGTLRVELQRIANLPELGWWPGELHVHRTSEEIELLMQAEDLHVAPVITWWNNRNLWSERPLPAEPLVRFDGDRYYHLLAGEDEREGGALLYFNLERPLDIAGAGREFPSPMRFVEAARARGRAKVLKCRRWPAGVLLGGSVGLSQTDLPLAIDIEKPFWWDVPVWLACGAADTIGLANNHMCRSRMYETEAWGRPRDAARLPPPRGNGFWSQEIYYHVLNCGLRVPPSAGSASGVLPNPVGYNRVYVHTGDDFSYAGWWEGLRAGRSFVSNGPLLIVRAAGELPGHVFRARGGEEVRLELSAEVTTRDRIREIEIIKDGVVERAVPYDEWRRSGSLGEIAFLESGWFLVRAIADVPETFRFASTAPFYVELGRARRRVSRASAQFFLDWVRERMGRVALDDPAERAEVLAYHATAEEFWQDVLARANAA